MQAVLDKVVPAAPAHADFLTHALTPNQNAAIVAIHFVTMYLELSIYYGGALIFPYAGSSLVAVAGAILNRSAIKPAHISLLSIIILTVLLSALFASISGNVVLVEFLRSFAQFTVALLSAYSIFIVAVLSSPKRMVILFSLILGVIIVGAFSERFGPVRAFSDAFRALLYPKNLLYSADLRDVVSYGALRPRFLTREPSLVGIGAGLLVCMIFLLWRGPFLFKATGAIVVAFGCIFIMRSPTILFFAAIVLYGGIGLRPTTAGRLSWIYILAITIVFIATPFILIYGSGVAGVSDRSIFGGGSYVIRIFGPPLIWLETLQSDPLFGLGLGSFESLLPTARHAYAAHGILALFPDLKDERDGSFLISNGFWEYWIFLGLAGGSIIIVALFRLFRSFGISYVAFPFFASVVALQTFGGISAYRPWHMLFIFAAIAFIVERRQQSASPEHQLR